MRFIGFILLSLLIAGCNDTAQNEAPTMGNFMEIAPDQIELDEIALEEQPDIVQDFFFLDETIIGDKFCYDYTALTQLILYGESNAWSKFEITENYLTAYHNECDVLLEFMTFELGGKKKAFLSQMNGYSQQFDCLNWNETKSSWLSWENFTKPTMPSYFGDLTKDEADLVTAYGADFIYINPIEKSAVFVFSAWAMEMNMGEKQLLNFDKNPVFDFELKNDGNHFSLEPISVTTPEPTAQLFMVGYSNAPVPSEEYRANYKKIVAGIGSAVLKDQFKYLDGNDFNVIFEKDSFDFSYMEQFEPRTGYWFYTPGNEPLDLGAEEEISIIIEKTRAYFKLDD